MSLRTGKGSIRNTSKAGIRRAKNAGVNRPPQNPNVDTSVAL